MLSIRFATPADIPAMRQIYNHYVANSAATFEEELLSSAAFEQRFSAIEQQFPYLVACLDNTVVGFAYASSFHPRSGYRFAAELSIYLGEASRHHGVGKKLYGVLLPLLKLLGFKQACACVAAPSGECDPYLPADSPAFHRCLGFRFVGQFAHIATKFGRDYDMQWWQLDLDVRRFSLAAFPKALVRRETTAKLTTPALLNDWLASHNLDKATLIWH